jgi:hypothetical protein
VKIEFELDDELAARITADNLKWVLSYDLKVCHNVEDILEIYSAQSAAKVLLPWFEAPDGD